MVFVCPARNGANEKNVISVNSVALWWKEIILCSQQYQ